MEKSRGKPAEPMKQLTIASRVSDAQKVHEAVLPEVSAHGYSADAQFAIHLALDEAIANAICHGNHEDPHRQIVIEYEISDEAVSISVHDEGDGFDRNSVPDPTLNENLDKPHGRGIMLMHAYMSKVEFSDKGNCVTIIKDRSCRRPL